MTSALKWRHQLVCRVRREFYYRPAGGAPGSFPSGAPLLYLRLLRGISGRDAGAVRARWLMNAGCASQSAPKVRLAYLQTFHGDKLLTDFGTRYRVQILSIPHSGDYRAYLALSCLFSVETSTTVRFRKIFHAGPDLRARLLCWRTLKDTGLPLPDC
jgi:hypothetical protein